jgi:hypothetical protein
MTAAHPASAIRFFSLALIFGLCLFSYGCNPTEERDDSSSDPLEDTNDSSSDLLEDTNDSSSDQGEVSEFEQCGVSECGPAIRCRDSLVEVAPLRRAVYCGEPGEPLIGEAVCDWSHSYACEQGCAVSLTRANEVFNVGLNGDALIRLAPLLCEENAHIDPATY